MPEQLKIIIDADVNKAIAGVQNLSKVITSDFVKATNTASAAASKLSDQVNASVQKINASLSGLKVTSLDVTVNTSSIDASIKSIQSKFNALVDPELNVFANTAQAEAKIKELIAELSTLKGSEIFIKANDSQALKAINEIEAELNSLVGKQINLTVTADIAKLEELKAKIAALKVTPINVTVNTSALDGSIKSIQSKFAALIDPEINVLANTEAAEVKIKELLTELSSLKGSEIFIRANDVQALKVINEVETELNSLLDKQIRLNVITTDATQKLNLLEKELADLQALTISPNISTQQLSLFEANIKRIKAEIAALKGQGVVIPIQANTVQAQANINKLSETIETLRAKIEARKSFITVETDITKIAAYNKEIEKLEARMRSIQNVGKRGFELFVVPGQAINSVKTLASSVAAFGGGVKTFVTPAVDAFKKLTPTINPLVGQFKALEKQSTATSAGFNKAFQSLKTIANIIPGIGIAGLIGAITTAVGTMVAAFTSATSKAKNFADATRDAIGGSAAEIFKINAAVAVIKDHTSSLNAQKNAREFLNKEVGISNNLLTKEKINTEEATKAIKAATDAIFQKALAEAFASKSAQKQVELFEKQEKLAKALKSIPTTPLGVFLNANAVTGALSVAAVLEKEIANIKESITAIEKFGQDAFKKAFDFTKPKKEAEKGFKDLTDSVIARARLFVKEFGDTFVLPNLEDSFFTSKAELLKASIKLLDGVSKDLKTQAALTHLEIKLPVFVTTETKLDAEDLKKFLRGEITRDQVKEIKVTVPVVTDLDFQTGVSLEKEFDAFRDNLVNRFITGEKLKVDIPVDVKLDPTLSKESIEAINKKLDLKGKFSILGDLGLKEFEKIDFSNINEGIAEATKRLQGMMEIAQTLNQAIGQGLVNAFNAAFDAVLEGKSVFKALGEAIKQLVIGTIKAIAQMLILRLVTNAIFPGSGGAIGQIFGGSFGGLGGVANFGTGGIGSSAFSNVIQIVGTSTISGNDIVLTYNRSSNSSGRFG